MTRPPIDQLVFGYEEGHRLLGGSTGVPATALAFLLGATDASIESSSGRLVTGFPLDAVGRYALCFTWNARELPRPGAVWSHVLLVHPGHFESPSAVRLLRDLARRPEPYGLKHYDTQLSLENGLATRSAVSVSLIEAIANAVYGEGESVVVHKDLAEAEEALFAVWEAQWPDLRSCFEFRTRESTRVLSSGGVVVARRVRGMTRQGESLQRDAWISKLAASIAQPTLPLHRFLGAFGPVGTADASTVGALTRLYCHVESENCTGVREVLESRYPDPRSGGGLKEQLFGEPQGSWWAASEASRLGAILGASVDAWDLEALAFERRLSDRIGKCGVGPVIENLSQRGAEPIRETVLNALLHSGKASDLSAVARRHPALAARWLVENPVVGWEPDAWRGLEPGQVRAVFTILGSPDSMSVLAAAVAGHARAAIDILGFSNALMCAARTKNFAAAAALLEVSTWSSAVGISAADPEVALLLGVISGGREVPGLLGALESRRDDIDGTWLKAAAVAMSRSDRPTGEVLEIVFGPLYHAIKDDRLPSGCWEFLNRMLPDGRDPAQRFRRFLIRVAKEEGWRRKKYQRALRGAGAYASELYREFNNENLRIGRIRKFIESL